MWRRFRTILLAHAIASWLAMSVMWTVQLSGPNNPTHTFDNPTFWGIFAVTEIAAPIFVPIEFVALIMLHRPEVLGILTALAGTYSVTAAMAFPLLLRRLSRKIANERRKLGQCARCGYDLRATPNHCPECGEAAPSHN